MRTPALVFTNSLLFSQMYLHDIHAFPEHCDSCPAPGLCEQHQELPSSPGARLQTAATPGCVAVSAAQAETSQILFVTESVNCSEMHQVCVFFNSQVVSGFTNAFRTGGWFVEPEGFGLFNRHLILPPPAGWGHLCVFVPVQVWVGGCVQLPQEWHWVTEALAFPRLNRTLVSIFLTN